MSTVQTKETATSEAGRLLEAQRARKAAQEDALKLANRVQQLKKEEEKAAKRINETKKRAGEIHKLRKRNEDFRLEKEQFYALKNRELAHQMENLMTSKRESEKRKQEAAEVLARRKRELREATRADQMAHERILAEQRLMERKVALEKKEKVKTEHYVQRDKLYVHCQVVHAFHLFFPRGLFGTCTHVTSGPCTATDEFVIYFAG